MRPDHSLTALMAGCTTVGLGHFILPRRTDQDSRILWYEAISRPHTSRSSEACTANVVASAGPGQAVTAVAEIFNARASTTAGTTTRYSLGGLQTLLDNDNVYFGVQFTGTPCGVEESMTIRGWRYFR